MLQFGETLSKELRPTTFKLGDSVTYSEVYRPCSCLRIKAGQLGMTFQSTVHAATRGSSEERQQRARYSDAAAAAEASRAEVLTDGPPMGRRAPQTEPPRSRDADRLSGDFHGEKAP